MNALTYKIKNYYSSGYVHFKTALILPQVILLVQISVMKCPKEAIAVKELWKYSKFRQISDRLLSQLHNTLYVHTCFVFCSLLPRIACAVVHYDYSITRLQLAIT